MVRCAPCTSISTNVGTTSLHDSDDGFQNTRYVHSSGRECASCRAGIDEELTLMLISLKLVSVASDEQIDIQT